MKKLTLQDVKEHLESLLEEVDNVIEERGSDTVVKIKSNTYFCKGYYLEMGRGFIDFDNLVYDDEDE